MRRIASLGHLSAAALATTVLIGAAVAGGSLEPGSPARHEHGPPFAQPNKSGKSLIVPVERASEGRVYHAVTGRDRQIYFESDAPLEDITGQSNKVIGFAISGPDSDPAALRGGEWHLPVASLRTGIDLRDEHLRGKDWLDAAGHPNIVFQLERVDDIQRVKQTSAFSKYSATFVGDMTIHGVTRQVSLPDAVVILMPESDRTRKTALGDLMAIRVEHDVTLSDYGVSHPVIGDKVANNVRIKTQLYLSTVPPEDQPERG